MTEAARPQTFAASPLAAEPGPAPRALGTAARIRSWTEPRVRVWWTAALVLFVIAGYFMATNLIGGADDRWLVRNGMLVEAEIVAAAGSTIPGKSYPPEQRLPFTFTYTMPDGRQYTIDNQRLKAQRQRIGPGDTIPIYVDPNNPTHWTDRMTISYLEDTLLGLILAPVVLLLFLVALFQRRRLLRVWRDGQAIQAVVVDTRQSAAAPLSRLVRFMPRDGADKRIYTAIIPSRLASLQPGDSLCVVALPGRLHMAVVAALYE